MRPGEVYVHSRAREATLAQELSGGWFLLKGRLGWQVEEGTGDAELQARGYQER